MILNIKKTFNINIGIISTNILINNTKQIISHMNLLKQLVKNTNLDKINLLLINYENISYVSVRTKKCQHLKYC